MAKSIDLQEMVIQGLGVDVETASFEPYKEYNRFWKLEGEDISTGNDVNYIVYDCREEVGQFDKEVYREVLEALKDALCAPVIVFENLDAESATRDSIYSALKKADEKKEINKFFDEKISIYSAGKDEIVIEVEEKGINYLEYKTNATPFNEDAHYLDGYIYNVSYYELKKILNATGKKLFKENVRVGLENNKTGKKLKKAFKDYIRVGFLKELIGIEKIKNQREKIIETLALDEDIINTSSPDKFWFYHNGVTIFSYDNEKRINRSNNKIKLNPNKISIINGAQTITNFYQAMNELKIEISKLVRDINICDICNDEWIQSKLEKICKQVNMKTIIIDGSVQFVNKISAGLNTQIPIGEEDILATYPEVGQINENLKTGAIKITRDGDKSAEINLSVLEFIKKYLIVVGEPGRSKNLNKSELEKLLKEAVKKSEEPDFVNNLKILIDLDVWWKTIRKMEGFLNDDNPQNDQYYKYGKNYFGSYVLKRKPTEIDDENFYNLFNLFVKEFQSIQDEVSLEDFKSDTLFDKFSATFSEEDSSTYLNIDRSDLCQYVNEHRKTRYSIANTISDYLLQKGIDIPYFRVIAVEGKKIKEAYPFPSRTFNELYQEKKVDENVSSVEFENSRLKEEIEKRFPVFIAIWSEKGGEEEGTLIQNMELIEEFSFEKYLDDAKKVFDKTKEAFEQGDDTMFVKSGADLKFHIRPKGANSDDTFEFSNGMQITKRTFWANKETIKALIEESKYGYIFEDKEET